MNLNFSFMHKFGLQLIIIVSLFGPVSMHAQTSKDFNSQPDTLKYKSFAGLVLDAQTKQPVVFASVFLEGTNMGTVTNSEGKFLIKIPVSSSHNILGISCLSYKTKTIQLSDWKEDFRTILLASDLIPVKEVIIRELNARSLIEDALDKIRVNYPDEAATLTGFYRESIKKENNYLSVGEAVLDTYKGSYKKTLDFDRISIYKGRKSQFAKRKDTLMVKFMGGPTAMSYLDLAKNPGDVLSRTMLDNYDYNLSGFLQIDGRETYVIDFDQKDSVSLSLFKGKIYLDVETLAIVQISFEVSPKQFDKAIQYMVRKKPLGMKIVLLHANYLVKYRELRGKWVLNYTRMEMGFRSKWKKKLFYSNYYITSETAVTDIDFKNVIKPSSKDRMKLNDVFFEKVGYFEDPNFWGPENVIEPEESIQAAIKKIRKKLKKHR